MHLVSHTREISHRSIYQRGIMTNATATDPTATKVSIKRISLADRPKIVEISFNTQLHSRDEDLQFIREEYDPIGTDSCLVPPLIRALFADEGFGVRTVKLEKKALVVCFRAPQVNLDEFEDLVEKTLGHLGIKHVITLMKR